MSICTTSKYHQQHHHHLIGPFEATRTNVDANGKKTQQLQSTLHIRCSLVTGNVIAFTRVRRKTANKYESIWCPMRIIEYIVTSVYFFRHIHFIDATLRLNYKPEAYQLDENL